ncbi:MAG: NAD-dependent dehydratase [Candidatus Omnitrophica bacterium CG11_big_fil_rev_8_21_14_0_20_42_13]|uniref:UDP-glucuronate decarboxylase n=1 Tax=Candidatus Ghiorseimicrobium undicola TaxID=1974746 RepID=A0A2H0LZ01_9BACT|nr:MAG: NAD-dependent dehydratase [Candidatus Omnitrophica bacterium CG11_big_fil_rev_8_21_14_0_20_42_13]
MRRKNVLITGGAGFIGSHLCEKLLFCGYRVICMDNLLTGRLLNIKHFAKNKNFIFIKHNVCEHITLKQEINYILHFASPASPADYLNYPIQTLKVGSLGTHNALGLARQKKAVFLLASTSEVYGDPLVHPQPESYWGNVNPIGPRGVYDEAKRFAEAITLAYHRVHKIDTKIVRIFNTYGPRMRKNDGRAIPNFISQALSNKDITVFGRGSQTRSFCYIDDLTDGIVKLMLSGVNEPVNLGNPAEFTVLELAKKIIALTATKSKVVFKPLPQDDPKVRCPDITKARKILRWQPSVSLSEGLMKTITYFKES